MPVQQIDLMTTTAANSPLDPVGVEAISAWLEANGIDPKTVPRGACISVDTDEQTITYEHWVYDEQGRRRQSRCGCNAVREHSTVPLLHAVDDPSLNLPIPLSLYPPTS